MKTEEKKKKLSIWIKGLLIFFLVIIVLGIILGFYISKQIGRARVEMAKSFVKSVEKYEREGTLLGEQLVLLKEMAGVLNQPDVTTWAVLLSNGIFYQAMKDKQISDLEYADMQLINNFLKETNGKISFAQLGKFFNENPRIKTAFESMKKKN